MTTSSIPSSAVSPRKSIRWGSSFLARIGHLWVENPWQLLTFTWRLIVASVRAGSERPLHTSLQYGWMAWKQIGRTLLRTAIPALGLGGALGIAIGNIVSGGGGIVRFFFDTFALTVIFKQVLPLIVAILMVARVGASIAGKFSTAPLFSPSATGGVGPFRSQNRDLLGQVAPLIMAGAITGGAIYLLLVIWVIAGYTSDGIIAAIILPSPGDIIGFIDERQIWGEIYKGLAESAMFGFVVAYVAAALGIAAGARVAAGSNDPEDFYYATWESGATSLILCAVIIALM